MAKKKANSRKMTAKRKLFIKAVAALEKFFDEHGVVQGDIDDMAETILVLRDGSPKNISDLHSFAAICGSALYFLNQISEQRILEECSETCCGAQVFEAVFYAGWSMGFAAGKDEFADECVKDRRLLASNDSHAKDGQQ